MHFFVRIAFYVKELYAHFTYKKIKEKDDCGFGYSLGKKRGLHNNSFARQAITWAFVHYQAVEVKVKWRKIYQEGE